MRQTTGGLGQPVVMGEHDHLPGARQVVEHLGETLDLVGIHRLHRVVQHQEPERTLLRRRPRQEQGQGQ